MFRQPLLHRPRKVDISEHVLSQVWLRKRIPICLSVVASVAFAFPTDEVFVAASFAGSAIMLFAGWALVFRLNQFRLSWLLATGLLLGYSAGSFNTSSRLMMEGMPLSRYFSRPQADLSTALAVTLVVSAILFFVGAAFETPIRINLQKLKSSDFSVVWFGLILVGTAFLTGKQGFGGAAVSDERRISVLGLLAGTIAPVLPGLIFLFQPKFRSAVPRTLSWVLLGVTIVLLVPQGRRVLIYGVLMAIVACNLRGVRYRADIWKKALVIVALLPILYFGSKFFYAMRVTSWQMGKGKVALSTLTSRSFDFMQNHADQSFDQQVSKNLRDRTFVLGYFSDLLAASRTHEPLYGEDALFCFEVSVPSVLFRDKYRVTDIGMEEAVANPQFGLAVKDEANSILTTGISDFGLAGALFYPVALSLLLNMFVRFLGRKIPEAKLLIVFVVVDIMWQTETSTGAYFVLCRDMVLISLALTLIHKVFRLFQPISPNQRYRLPILLALPPQVAPVDSAKFGRSR